MSGTYPGFAYSTANATKGVTWNEETLFEYLEDPRKYIPGTKMVFDGIKNPDDRRELIAYLKGSSKYDH